MDMHTLLGLKLVANNSLFCSTWSSAQYYVATWMGGSFGVEWIYV